MSTGISEKPAGKTPHLLCLALHICLMGVVSHRAPGTSKNLQLMILEVQKGRCLEPGVSLLCSSRNTLQSARYLLETALTMCQAPEEALCRWHLTGLQPVDKEAGAQGGSGE